MAAGDSFASFTPTILTLPMFPVLVWMYARLARQEEREARADFGEQYAQYAARTPAFFPNLGRTKNHGTNDDKS